MTMVVYVCGCVNVCFSVTKPTCDFADVGLVTCDVERFSDGRHLAISTARHGV